MKRIMITGANSYIGNAVKDYLEKYDKLYEVCIRDTINWRPNCSDFLGIDVVFNVAGIAHINENKKNRNLYYKINHDLVVDIAKAAKLGGVKQFILLSTMSVYGLTTGYIDKNTIEHAQNAYGLSKLQADNEIKKLASDDFKFACLRPPMVYGKGCKGNYRRLRKFVLKSLVFPQYNNQRSMIYIGNLCSFVKNVIDNEKSGLFFPQNEDYINTYEMVKLIAETHNKKMIFTKIFNPFIMISPFKTVKKAFGDLIYEPTDLVNTYSFEESIKLSEK